MACSGNDALFSQDRGPDASRRNGGRQVPAACGSDALLLRDALVMHHVGMAAGWNQQRAAGATHYFRGTEVLMHHVGMAVGRYQRHAGVMHCFCGMLS